jgi:hypothetical protein
MTGVVTAPGTVAGTGHVVGVTYACHYWGGTYEVLAAVGDSDVKVRNSDGTVRVHSTWLYLDPVGDSRNDHPVSEPCVWRLECRLRAGNGGT